MSTISLESSIRTCKVDTAWADKMESDRFLNPNLMLCPPWNGVDTAGRPACEYSFYSKTPGCNSAMDRVAIENEQRPRYIEYVNLDASGIRGSEICKGSSYVNPETKCNRKVMGAAHMQTGQFGLNTGFQQNIYPNCLSCSRYPERRANGKIEGYCPMKK